MGSTAYGLDHADSDRDLLGVFVAPSSEFWRLRGPRQTYVHTEPDSTLHEVAKFITLALKCNPTVLELLWLDDYQAKDYWGARLIDMRKSFLSTDYVRGAFGGYAMQQARRLERRNAEGKEGFASDVKTRTAKHARHCFRLMRQGAELLATGDMHIRVTAEERANLFELGELPVPEIVQRFEAEHERFQHIKSVLPDDPNNGYVERALARLRLYHFHGEQADSLVHIGAV